MLLLFLIARHGCRVVALQTGGAFLQSKNAVVSGARMYRERTLLGFILLSRESKNAKSVFLLSDALINPARGTSRFALVASSALHGTDAVSLLCRPVAHFCKAKMR